MSASPATWDVGLSVAPYPGLRPFRREEADIFFGRDEQVDQLLAKLEHNHFLAVVGPSGAGKSSLVRAGLLSALEAGFLARAGVSWRVVEMRPGNHPISTLSQTLLESGLLGEHWNEHPQAVPFLTALLQRGPLSLINLLRESQLPSRTNLLLLVDQFEEIFRFHDYGDPNEAIAFVSMLLATARHPDTPVFVVLTMRSDFLGECAVFQGLPEALNDSQFLTPRLSREQCEAAILGPAAVFDAQVDPGLVNRILNDMGTDPDQLPLMQHALMRVWTMATKSRDQATVNGSVVGGTLSGGSSTNPAKLQLTLNHYEAVGGLAQGLSRHADEVYDSLSPEDRRVAEILFRGLSERSQGQRDTRRPALLQAIAKVADVPTEKVASVVEAFRHPDCCFLTPPAGNPLTDDTLLDVSHESLIRQWERMAGWVEKEHESATMYRRLDQTAKLWQQDQAGLWGDPDLSHALEWQTREKPNPAWANRYSGDFSLAMDFLHRSQQEHLRRQDEERANLALRNRVKKLKLSLGLGSIVILIVSAVMMWAIYQRGEAERQRGVAEKARDNEKIAKEMVAIQASNTETQHRIATARLLAVESNVVRERQPELSILLAVAALRSTIPNRQHEVSAEQALRDALSVDASYRLRGHQGPIEGLNMTTDGRWLVTTSLDGTARLWSLTASDPAQRSWLLQPTLSNVPLGMSRRDADDPLVIHPASLNASSELPRTEVRWMSDSVATARSTRSVHNANTDSYPVALLQAAPSGKGPTTERGLVTVALSPDGRWLVTGETDFENWLWDLHGNDPTGNPIRLPGIESFSLQREERESEGKSGSARQFQPFLQMRPPSPLGQLAPRGPQSIFSPNGRWLLTTYGGGGARLWDFAAEDPARTGVDLPNDAETIERATFSSDGRWLVTTEDASLRLWDLTADTTQLDSRDMEMPWEVTGLALSRDSRWLAATDGQSTIRVWDLRADEAWTAFRDLNSPVTRADFLAISPDSRWLVAAMNQATRHTRPITLGLWDLKADPFVVDGTELTGQATLINALAFSPPPSPAEPQPANDEALPMPETRWLITGGADGTVGRWDLWELARHQQASITPVDPHQVAAIDAPARSPGFRLLVGHEDAIRAVATVPSGKWAITGSGDTTVRLWDLANDSSGAPLVLRGHDGPVTALAANATERWLASGSVDRTVRLWDLSSPALMSSSLTVRGHQAAVSKVLFEHEGQRMFTASWDGTIRYWQKVPGNEQYQEKFRIEAHESAVNSLAMGSDGTWMASGGADGIVKVWNVADGAEILALSGHSNSVTSVAAGTAVGSNNRWVASGSFDGTVRIWDASSGDEVHRLEGPPGAVLGVAFGPYGTMVASGHSDGTVALWDRASGSGVRTFNIRESAVNAVLFSTDGSRVLAGSSDGMVRMWDIGTGQLHGTPLPHDGRPVRALALSAKGTHLATGSDDYLVRLWNLESTESVMTPIMLRGHEDQVFSVALSSDGRWVASGSADQTVRRWALRTEDLEQQALRATGHRRLSQREWDRFMPADDVIRNVFGDVFDDLRPR